MIGYLILVHRFPEQFKRLFKATHDPRNSYVVHVDKNSGETLDADIRDFLQPYSNAEVMEGRAALWGGYSLVDAELRGMEHLLAMDGNWSHFINLSGQDFPLKTQPQIIAHLRAHPNREYIKVLDQKKIRPDTPHRRVRYRTGWPDRADADDAAISRGSYTLYRQPVDDRQPGILQLRL